MKNNGKQVLHGKSGFRKTHAKIGNCARNSGKEQDFGHFFREKMVMATMAQAEGISSSSSDGGVQLTGLVGGAPKAEAPFFGARRGRR